MKLLYPPGISRTIYILALLFSISFKGFTQVIPAFTTPDTVCVKTPVSITNASTGASSYYWNFCVADLNQTTPQGQNLGNPNGLLSVPVFMDYVKVVSNYYGFLVDMYPNRLIRLDFGTSLLNAPAAVDLGNFGGIIPINAEGIQLVYNEGRWYAIIVGGSQKDQTGPRVLKVDFGADITNTTPAATSWGNIGGLTYPTDLHVFKEGANWYGFTVNAEDNTITRFNFTSSFNNTPTAVNLGNLGSLSFPTGIYIINDNGYWRGFIVNAGNNSRTSGVYSLTRLDFGTSLLNTPVGVNLGNPGNMLQHPRDLTIMKMCDQIIGFAVNGHASNSNTIKIDFHNDLSATPTLSSMGTLGNSSFPHSISKLFRVNDDVYGFVTNVDNNTITRLRFSGCTNASIPNATVKDPAPVTYSAPGTYNISLTVDDGLPTQAAFCKQVVVLAEPLKSAAKNISLCTGERVKIGSSIKMATYSWSTGATTDSISVSVPGTYWVESNRFDCSVRDSFIVSNKTMPDVDIHNRDTAIYAGDYVQLKSTSANGTYAWSPAASLSCSSCSDPVAAPQATTTYVLSGGASCFSRDQVTITVMDSPQSCSDLQLSLGGAGNERAVDVAKTANREFYVAGTSKSFGNGEEILVSKLKIDGTVLWSRTYGGARDESVRKITTTSDGGLLVIGQTKSFSNLNGDILALKVNSSGALVWSRKFGLGSASGDLGMDIIETGDGGYALSGIINAVGSLADQVVIRLNSAADIVWSKRFDRGDGEDGVGILEKGDTLIVASDLQNTAFDYHMQVMKLRMSDGEFISSRKLVPGARGLFNPYLFKNPSGPGYYVSGHTIDGTSYANMQQAILMLDENFNLIKTSLINTAPVANDFFTGFYPLADGSFLSCASSQVNADGYLWRIGNDQTLLLSKRINKPSDVRLYRLTVLGGEAVAVGGITRNGQEDYFITTFPVEGPRSNACDVESVTASIRQPGYTSTDFTWPTISSPSFSNTSAALTSSAVDLNKISLCSSALNPNYTFEQDICSPTTVHFKTYLFNISSYEWHFGDGQADAGNANPTHTFADFGTYPVQLVVESNGGCKDSITKDIQVFSSQGDLIYNRDTTICAGDSVLLQTAGSNLEYCWRTSDNSPVAPGSSVTVKPLATTTYYYTSKVQGKNLVANGSFSDGNTGFLSDYQNAASGLPEGVYAVRADVLPWHPYMSPCTDHTTGSGNMMLVNGSPVQNTRVWSQTITVAPNTDYAFSAWLQSIAVGNPAELQFSINGKMIGNLFKAAYQSCQWNQFYTIWNSGASTTATISIVNMNQNFTGNDFALDDIFFGEYQLKTDQVSVRVLERPDVTVGENMSICQDSTVQLRAAASAGASISWSPALYLSNAAISNPTSHPLNSVTYTATALNENGCFRKDSLLIRVIKKPMFTLLRDTSLCRGASVLLNTQLSGATAFSWQPEAGLSNATAANPLANPSASTQYIFTATNEGCAVADSVYIEVKALPQVRVTRDTAICESARVQLQASGGVTYQWSPAAGLSATSIATPVASPLASTSYTVTVGSDNGCTASDSVHVSVTPKPRFTLWPVNPSVCIGDTIVLKARGGDRYSWSPAASLSSADSSMTVAAPTATTTYKVMVWQKVCAVEDSLFTRVTVHPLPVFSVTKSNDIDCAQKVTRLSASGGYSYQWTPSEGLSNSRVANPIASPEQTTLYSVKATSAEGCAAIGNVTVQVEATGENKLYVPSAFTPNNDGKNDCFSLWYWGDVKDFSLSIFNRWGERVFYSTNPAQCWDGNYKGIRQPSGVFVYFIKGKTLCGDMQTKGTLTLVR